MEANEDVHGEAKHNADAGGNDTNNTTSIKGDGSANGTGSNAVASNESMASSSDNNICRDYMRNVCTRGRKCKYNHPEKEESNAAATLLQDSIVFCHDFQNRND